LVGRINSYNQLQSSGLSPTVAARVTNANTGLYTVPAGKKARVTSITLNLNAVGADATYAVAIKRGATFTPVGLHVGVNGLSVFNGVMMLDAGDIVTNLGDAGATNGTCDMSTTFQEYDV